MIEQFWREPDRWQGTMNGLSVYAARNPLKAWCGYCGVDSSHPLFGKGYDTRIKIPDRAEVKLNFFAPLTNFLEALHEDDGRVSLAIYTEVHGALTYANTAWWDDTSPLWWFGFDCNHSGDLAPHDHYASSWSAYGQYRTLEYVKENLETLSRKLKELA